VGCWNEGPRNQILVNWTGSIQVFGYSNIQVNSRQNEQGIPRVLWNIKMNYYTKTEIFTTLTVKINVFRSDTMSLRQSFTVLCATLRSTKLITFTSLKQFLKYSICFGPHGHHQVLKIYLMGKSLLSLVSDVYAVLLMCVRVCVFVCVLWLVCYAPPCVLRCVSFKNLINLWKW
jgi:hypothetical protein